MKIRSQESRALAISPAFPQRAWRTEEPASPRRTANMNSFILPLPSILRAIGSSSNSSIRLSASVNPSSHFGHSQPRHYLGTRVAGTVRWLPSQLRGLDHRAALNAQQEPQQVVFPARLRPPPPLQEGASYSTNSGSPIVNICRAAQVCPFTSPGQCHKYWAHILLVFFLEDDSFRTVTVIPPVAVLVTPSSTACRLMSWMILLFFIHLKWQSFCLFSHLR